MSTMIIIFVYIFGILLLVSLSCMLYNEKKFNYQAIHHISDHDIPINPISSHYYLLGDKTKPTIVMVMGWMCSVSMWTDTFLQDLVEHGYSLLIFNNPGISGIPTLKKYTFENISKIIDSFYVKDPIVLGWSMGAMIAFYYSMTRGCSHCISICGGNIDIGTKTLNPINPNQVSDDFFIKTRKENFDLLLYKNAVNQIIPFREIGTQQASAMIDYQTNINKLIHCQKKTKILFITAEKDVMIPPSKNIDFLQKNYPTHMIRFYEFKNEGHGVLYTKEKEISRMISKFLQ